MVDTCQWKNLQEILNSILNQVVIAHMILTYIQQSGSPPVGDGGDQYTGLDRFGRVIDQRWMKESSGGDLERVEYGFDRASNRVWRDNTVADALSAKQDEFYTYDGLNQLLTLQRGTLNSGKTGISGTPTWEEDFTIDPTGNWNNYVNQVNGTTTLNQPRTHNAVNEVETISGSGSLMTQNAAGNMSKAPQPTDWSSVYTMTYDAWQRLVKVKSGSTTVAIYAYDGQNRRVTKTTGTTLRHYYYSSQWQILEERLNTTTTADRQFVWGLMALDNLILRDRGTERFYSLQDVFSCTAIVDTTGTVQERYGYNAFGLSRVMDASFNVISASSYDWETRYDNYRFDSESNFYQVRNRYLHPTLGRWLTRDPLEYQDGINVYTYVANNTKNYIDPFGEERIKLWIAAFIGPSEIRFPYYTNPNAFWHGDDRSFNPGTRFMSSRVWHWIVVETDPTKNPAVANISGTGITSVTVYTVFGIETTATGQAPAPPVAVIKRNCCILDVNVSASTGNPLVIGSPKIKYSYDFSFDVKKGEMKVTGSHKIFPWYEVNTSKGSVEKFSPAPGATPASLFWPAKPITPKTLSIQKYPCHD